MRTFTESVCTGYPLLVRAQSLSYLDSLEAVIGDAQSPGEYLGGYGTRAGDDF